MADQDNESLRTVFIGVDGSKHSKRAFDFYLNEVFKSKDCVVVFHAQEVPQMTVSGLYPGLPYNYEDFQDAAQRSDDKAKNLLRYFGDKLKNKDDIRFKLIKEGGSPGPAICKNIAEENARVVIMGSRGQGSVRRTFLGSVSDYVVHHCHIPVCIVPPLESEKEA